MRQDEQPEESPPPKGALTLEQWKLAYDQLQLAQARLAALQQRGSEMAADAEDREARVRHEQAEVERLRVVVEGMVGDYVASAERARKFASTAGRRQKLRARWHPEKPPAEGATDSGERSDPNED